MSKHLPAIVFLLCIVIALILVFSFGSWWPAALAIAISGAALAIGLRNLDGTLDGGSYVHELSELRDENATLRADLIETRATIEDLSDVVERVASTTVESNRNDGAVGAVDPDLIERISALETKLGATPVEDEMTLEDLAPEPSQGASAGQLRNLMARVSGSTDSVEKPDDELDLTSEAAMPVRLSPVFLPQLGAPVSFIVSAEGDEDLDDLSGLFAQAARIADQLEGAERDVDLFVRLSAANLANEAIRDGVLNLIDSDEALRKRLTLMTPQEGFTDDSKIALSAFVERGCKFALSDVRDWSLNLTMLARAGLAYIAVDGPAMTRSAQAQGGDPRRLAEALAVHDVALIAGHVKQRADIDGVRLLHPALVAGEGLGASRLVESIA